MKKAPKQMPVVLASCTAGALAEATGASLASAYAWLSGRSLPKRKHLPIIAKTFPHITVAMLSEAYVHDTERRKVGAR